MGDRGPAATYQLTAWRRDEFSRWEIGGQPQPTTRRIRGAASLADGRSGASRNWYQLACPMPCSLADGRSGASRNVTTEAVSYTDSLADGRSGASRNDIQHFTQRGQSLADGRSGTSRNIAGDVAAPSASLADGRSGASRNDHRVVVLISGSWLCQISDHETQRDDVRLDRLSRARRHLRDQPVPARKEQPALVGQRDVRAASTAHPKVLSQLVKRRAESRC